MAELRTLTRWVRMPRGQAYLVALGMVLLAIVISVNAPNLADNISTDAVNDARFVPVASAFDGVVTNAGSVDGTAHEAQSDDAHKADMTGSDAVIDNEIDRAECRDDPTGAIMVHLASYRDVENANTGWSQLLSEYGDLLGGLGPLVNQVEIPNKGTFYRLRAGPLESLDAAKRLCAGLKARGAYCDAKPAKA